MLGPCQPKVEVRDARGNTQSVIHAASHNYAGFYEQTSAAEELQRLCLDNIPLANSTAAQSLEAAFCRKITDLFEADFCCTTSTGYGSNLLAFPAILDKSWLVIFDEKCHNSMFVGAYQSTVGLIRKYKHNDMDQLEDILREHEDKYNILVAVEGAYRYVTNRAKQTGTVHQHGRYCPAARSNGCFEGAI
jgi:serine palmitoyltransferase